MNPRPHDYGFRASGSVAHLNPWNAERPFFSQKVEDALSISDPDERLTVLAKLISEAQAGKEAGYGPPLGELTAARRKWLALYAELYRRPDDAAA